MAGQVTIKTSNDINNVNRFSLSGKIGNLYTLEGALGNDSQLRLGLGIGGAVTAPQQGLLLNITSNELNLDEWQRFLQANNANRDEDGNSNPNSNSNSNTNIECGSE